LIFSFELFLNRVRRRETEEERAEGINYSGQQQRLNAKGTQRERERERDRSRRWLRSQDDIISFKISNRNQSPVSICCRHHNKPPHPHPPKKGEKQKKKRGWKIKRKKFVAEFFAWKVSQFKKKRKAYEVW